MRGRDFLAKLCYVKIFAFLFVSISASSSNGQSINNNWNQQLNKMLKEFTDCQNTNPGGVNPCLEYMGSSLKTVYNINDFYSSELERPMMVNEIAEFLKGSSKWTLLGHGYEQKALSEAQQHANSKRAVVAVYLNDEGIGHMALILPGQLSPSGSWGFQVPNSASFYPIEPDKSYVGKGLSYAFARNHIRHVMIYVRNY